MKTKLYQTTFNQHPAKSLVALLIVALLAFSEPCGPCAVRTGIRSLLLQPAQDPQPAAAPAQAVTDTPKIPNDQLDSLVAPIALYPDPLLSQVLVASTYPLELVQLQQWLHMKGQYMNEKATGGGGEKGGLGPKHSGDGGCCRRSSNDSRRTSSGPRTWETLFWPSRVT